MTVCRNRDLFPVQNIYRRLGKNSPAGGLKSVFTQVLHIIADKLTYLFHSCDTQITSDLLLQFFCLYRKSLLLLHINALYSSHESSSILFLSLSQHIYRYYYTGFSVFFNDNSQSRREIPAPKKS